MNVVLVAEESAGIGALRHLVQSPHRLVGVLAKDAPEGARSATVASVARRFEVPVWPAELVRDPELGRGYAMRASTCCSTSTRCSSLPRM